MFIYYFFVNSLINTDLDKQKEKQQQNIPQIREIFNKQQLQNWFYNAIKIEIAIKEW